MQSNYSFDSPGLSSTYDQLGSLDDTTIISSLSLNDTNNSPQLLSDIFSSIKPICLIDGFMSFEIMDIWTDVIAHIKKRAAINKTSCPPLHRLQSGGVSSAHDTAVSIFYQIKGGTEDFGEEHSNKHQHDRYGLTHPGIYPEWSGELPIHLLAHSFGGNVVLELQKLLDEQFFHNEQGETYLTDAGWILSAAFVSSPLRGTTVAYYLGKNPGESGIIRFFSIGRLLFIAAQIWEWLEFHDPRNGWLGIHFRLTHFGFSRNRSIWNLIQNIFRLELFDKGLDTAANDVIIEKYLVGPYHAHQNTFYRTYACSMTHTTSNNIEIPISHWCPGITYFSKILGRFDIIKEGKGLFDFMLSHETLWRKNDGLVSLISQLHPQDCLEESCHHIDLPNPSKPYNAYFPLKLNPGTWYTSIIPDCSHIDLVPGFNNTFNIPPVAERVSNWWSPLLGIIFPTSPKFKESSTSSSYSTTISEYRRIFIDDYLQFLTQVNLYHVSKST